jgi:hypothetical protein
MAEAATAGSLQSNRVIVTVAEVTDQIHNAAVKQAAPLLLDFIRRMQLPAAEVTKWVRPQLKKLGNVLLRSHSAEQSPGRSQAVT